MPEDVHLEQLERYDPPTLLNNIIRDTAELVHIVGLLTEEIGNLIDDPAEIKKEDLRQLTTYIGEELVRVRRVIAAAAVNQALSQSENRHVFVAEKEDNVGTLVGGTTAAGEQVLTTGRIIDIPLTLLTDADSGDKIAILPIAAGTVIYKYGLPLGAAARPLAAGDCLRAADIAPLQ